MVEDEGRAVSIVLVDLARAVVSKRLAKLDAMTLSLALSAGGKLVAAGDETGILRAWDLASGRVTASVDTGLKATRGLAFGPDGKSIYASGDRGIRA